MYPLPYPTKPPRKTHNPTHLPPIYPAPKISMFPALAGERFAPSLTDDRRSTRPPPPSLRRPHPSHVPFAVPLRSHPIMDLRRVPLQRRQISLLSPSLLPLSFIRTCPQRRYLHWNIHLLTTLGGTASIPGPISTANRWMPSVLPHGTIPVPWMAAIPRLRSTLRQRPKNVS